MRQWGAGDNSSLCGVKSKTLTLTRLNPRLAQFNLTSGSQHTARGRFTQPPRGMIDKTMQQNNFKHHFISIGLLKLSAFVLMVG